MIGAFVVLGAGLAGGLLLWWRLGSRGIPIASAADERGRDLEARRDSAIARLRALPPDAAASERLALEVAAAEAWREMDRADASSRTTPTPAASATRGGLRGFVWGAGTAAGVAALLFLVSRSAGQRREGESLTGNAAVRAEAAGDPELAPLEETIRRNPEDLDARIALVQAALGRQDLMRVFEETRYVLERSPGHPRALSYQALVRLAMGQPEVAVQMLKQALSTEPGLLEAYLHLALVHVRTGQLAEGEAAIGEAARRYPDQAERLRSLWSEMKAAGPGAGDAQIADAHTGVAAAPEAAGTAGAVAGTVELSTGLQERPRAGATVFITLRPEGVRSGPPVAAKRLPVGSWPMAFRIGAEDSMMGGALPDRVRVEARVDSDGDPLTRDPADPSATQDAVTVGRGDLRLVLTR